MDSQDSVELPGTRSEPPPYVLGERGAPLEAPENTLAGLRRALEVGADGVACDVRATADGELILLADEDLDRRAGGKRVETPELAKIHYQLA